MDGEVEEKGKKKSVFLEVLSKNKSVGRSDSVTCSLCSFMFLYVPC